MVEGDGCHRVAAAHRKSLVGRKMAARSPNGRFKAGAQAIVAAGGVLLKIEVHGKNMFYFFGPKGGAPSLAVHVHFGMAGAFAVYKGEEPETTGTTRLRLETVDTGPKLPKLVAHLSAMTTEHGTPAELYEPIRAKLGPDPLRKDADPKRFVACCAAAAKPIGGMLMDQSVTAGVGNIYRSEVLYEAGVHPNQPANTLTQKEVLHVWAVAVKQMQAGFKTGSIWGLKPGPACYGLTTSACGGKVKSWAMGGRTVFACSKRQRLDKARPVVATPRAKPGLPSGKVVSAARAESKKRKTGEGLGVQHVALKDDATRAAALAAARRRAKAGGKATGKRGAAVAAAAPRGTAKRRRAVA